VPFLAEKRLVIVERLLERFELKAKTARKKTNRTPEPSEEYKKIAEGIKHLPEFTELVITGGDVKNSNPLLREISAVGRVKAFPLLKSNQLGKWIEERVAAAGSRISPPAVTLLVRFVGSNLWIMASEVDKLTLYTGGRRIEEADVRAVVSYAREARVFAMTDTILEFRVGAAQEILQQLLKQGELPAPLLVMLSRQVRIIFLIREMRDHGKSRAEIQNKLGLAHDFLMSRAWEQSDRYTPARIREVYHRLLEADISIKTGKYDGELALNILVAELGQRGALATQ
jgi:DNA polymerase-3 subunit delta